MPNSTRRILRCSNGLTYASGCRCVFCRKQAAFLQNEYRRRVDARAKGAVFPTDRVDPAPSIALVAQALEHGITQRELERLTGLQRLVFQRMGERKWITRDTANRIRTALQESDIRAFYPTTKVNARWTQQMINSLSAQGWTHTHQRKIIQENLGITAGFIAGLSCGVWETTWYQNEQAIRWLVIQIGDAIGPSTRAAKMAANRGHFPTKHYDTTGKLVVKSLGAEQRKSLEGV